MNKQEVLDKYGEYEIPLEIAKTLEEYDFRLNWNFQDFKDYIKECNEMNKILPFKVKGIDVVAKLQFNHIDLEMSIRNWNEEENKLFINYYCCCQSSPTKLNEDGWNSFDGSDLIFDISQIETEQKLEEVMYNELIKMAEHNDLYWSKLND